MKPMRFIPYVPAIVLLFISTAAATGSSDLAFLTSETFTNTSKFTPTSIVTPGSTLTLFTVSGVPFSTSPSSKFTPANIVTGSTLALNLLMSFPTSRSCSITLCVIPLLSGITSTNTMHNALTAAIFGSDFVPLSTSISALAEASSLTDTISVTQTSSLATPLDSSQPDIVVSTFTTIIHPALSTNIFGESPQTITITTEHTIFIATNTSSGTISLQPQKTSRAMLGHTLDIIDALYLMAFAVAFIAL